MAPDISAEPVVEESPLTLSEVGAYSSYSSGAEHGLVVLAMGLAYWLVPSGDRFVLLVETSTVAAVREQLRRFERESAGWPPDHSLSPVEVARPVDLFTPLLWAALLLGAFRAQQWWPAWTRMAALDAAAIFERGEGWRAGSALWVHADVGHLVANVLSGIFVFSAVTSTMGRRRGWALLALAAVVGNFASAWLRFPTDYVSVGASTAIFAGLGLLTGRAVRVAVHSPGRRRWTAMFVPFAAGLTMLALYGSGELRVDVGAHVCGFAAGLLFGLLAGFARRDEP